MTVPNLRNRHLNRNKIRFIYQSEALDRSVGLRVQACHRHHHQLRSIIVKQSRYRTKIVRRVFVVKSISVLRIQTIVNRQERKMDYRQHGLPTEAVPVHYRNQVSLIEHYCRNYAVVNQLVIANKFYFSCVPVETVKKIENFNLVIIRHCTITYLIEQEREEKSQALNLHVNNMNMSGLENRLLVTFIVSENGVVNLADRDYLKRLSRVNSIKTCCDFCEQEAEEVRIEVLDKFLTCTSSKDECKSCIMRSSRYLQTIVYC